MGAADLDVLLLIGGVVLLVSVAAVRLAVGSGLPTLLLYLGVGLLLGENVLGLGFDDAALARSLGYAALVVILAEGGLTTSWQEIKPVVPAAAMLATIGTAVSVAVVGTAAHLLLGVDWGEALLIGAVLAPTDSAAVFSVLRTVRLPPRLGGLLEAESGFNDAPVVIAVVALATTSGVGGAGAGGVTAWWQLLLLVAYELVLGGVVGVLVGVSGAWGLRRLALPSSGLYPLAVLALCVTAYGAAAVLHGSGFLATYLAALVLGNVRLPHRSATRGFAEGSAWLAQIGLFVMLGLLATPADLGPSILPAMGIGLVLLLVARPLAVLLSLAPLGFRLPWAWWARWSFATTTAERLLLSWAGLRGAVPVVLATVPAEKAVFNLVFVLVVVFTVVQGPTLPWVARRLGVASRDEAEQLDIEWSPLTRLDADLLQVHVSRGSRLAGVEIGELDLPAGAAVMLVVHDGEAAVPRPSTPVRVGDELVVVTSESARREVERRLRAVSLRGRLADWTRKDP